MRKIGIILLTLLFVFGFDLYADDVQHYYIYAIDDIDFDCPICGEFMDLDQDIIMFSSCEDPESVTYTFTCPNCHYVKTEIETNPYSHAYAEIDRVEADCTTDGYITKKCDICFKIITETIDALGHNPGTTTIINEATCTEDGMSSHVCTHCGGTYNTVINKLGHNVTSLHQDASCTEDGFERQVCTRCNKVLSDTVLTALGHDLQHEHQDATCNEDGYDRDYCLRCNQMITDTTLHASGHDIDTSKSLSGIAQDNPQYIFQHIDADCTTDGYDRLFCTKCNKTVVENVIPATGHDFTDWQIEKEATATEEGLRSRICKICQRKEEEAIVTKEVITPAGAAAIGVGSMALALLAAIKVFSSNSTVSFASIFAAKTAVTSGEALMNQFGQSTTNEAVRKTAEELGEEILEDVAEDVAEETVEATATGTFKKPSIETKTFLVCMKSTPLYVMIRANTYIKFNECKYDEIGKTITEKKPDLTLVDISGMKLGSFTKDLKQWGDDKNKPKVAVLVDEKQLNTYKKRLDKLVEDKTITGYGLNEKEDEINMVKLVLPAMKPKLNSDNTLKNIRSLCDMLGIEGVSGIISTYLTSKSLKDSVASVKDKIDLATAASIIGGIAKLLGKDEVVSVTDLISDLNTLKKFAKNKKKGGKDIKDAKGAVEDIAGKVNDYINKDE